jgi:hypothetical protein
MAKLISRLSAMNNVLFDGTTKRITAMLDFDWACVTHPTHEFFTGLWDLGGGTHPDDQQLQNAVLTGKFHLSDSAVFSLEAEIKWEIAKAWDSALAANNAIRPSSIKAVEKLEKLRNLEELLCPFALTNEVLVKYKSPEQLQKGRSETEAKLTAILDSIGA